MDQGGNTRPSVLDRASETQMLELERQFAEGDRGEWDVLTKSYGWSSDESGNVWDWFNRRPTKDAPVPKSQEDTL